MHRRHAGAVGGSVLVVAVVAMALSAGQEPTASTAPASAPASSVPPLSATLTPEDGGEFWASAIHYAPTSFHFDSLEAIVADSHLIIRGRIVAFGVSTTEPFDPGLPALPSSFAVVRVDEILAGTPATRDPGHILVARLAAPDSSDPPPEDVVLFLKNYAQMRIEMSAPPAADPGDRFLYVRPNEYQGALVNRNGRVFIPPPPPYWIGSYGPFPFAMSGMTFDEALARIREVVSLHGSSTST